MTHSPSHTALAWREIGDGAPSETLVLVYGNAPVRFGYRDALGNWRAKHHGPLRTPPTHWMPLPLPPGTEPPQSINSHGALQAENERLREQVKELRGALRPFAETADLVPPGWEDDHSLGEWALCLDVADLRRAHALLNPQEPNNATE